MKYSIKCDTCGKFISYVDIINGRVRELFTPDSDVSREEHYYRCLPCVEIHGAPQSVQQFHPNK